LQGSAKIAYTAGNTSGKLSIHTHNALYTILSFSNNQRPNLTTRTLTCQDLGYENKNKNKNLRLKFLKSKNKNMIAKIVIFSLISLDLNQLMIMPVLWAFLFIW
jgi:hypothetical protein